MTEFRFIKGKARDNLVLEHPSQEFYISYSKPHPLEINLPNGETAIVFSKNGDTEYLILDGDFREEYLKLFPEGLDACINFYNKEMEEKYDRT